MIAENREFYSALADNFKEIPFTLDLNWDAVYFDKILNLLSYCTECAVGHASAALDTLVLIYHIGRLYLSADRVHRAVSRAL